MPPRQPKNINKLSVILPERISAQVDSRIERESAEYEVEALRREIEAKINLLLSQFEVTGIEIDKDGKTLTYYMTDGRLGAENRQLLHQVVLVISDANNVIGTVIVEGGTFRMLEKGKIIRLPQEDGSSFSMEEIDPAKRCKIEGARIKIHSFGEGGIKLKGDESFVALYPAGLR
jgi:hypothetical protein